MAGLFHFSGWIRVSNCVVFSILLFMFRIIIYLKVNTLTEYFYFPFMGVASCNAQEKGGPRGFLVIISASGVQTGNTTCIGAQ